MDSRMENDKFHNQLASKGLSNMDNCMESYLDFEFLVYCCQIVVGSSDFQIFHKLNKVFRMGHRKRDRILNRKAVHNNHLMSHKEFRNNHLKVGEVRNSHSEAGKVRNNHLHDTHLKVEDFHNSH